MLRGSDLSTRHGDRLVLNHVSFFVDGGDRIGLVGANGAGTSTLLSIVAGGKAPARGSVKLVPGGRVGHPRQGFADLRDATIGAPSIEVGHRLGDSPSAQAPVDGATSEMAAPGADSDAALGAYDRGRNGRPILPAPVGLCGRDRRSPRGEALLL